MIVIAKIVSVQEQDPLDESVNIDVVDLAFDRGDNEEAKDNRNDN